MLNKLDSLGMGGDQTQYRGPELLQAVQFNPTQSANQQRTHKDALSTYRAHTFGHVKSMHDYSESSPAKRGYSQFIFDLGKLGGGIEDPHVV